MGRPLLVIPRLGIQRAAKRHAAYHYGPGSMTTMQKAAGQMLQAFCALWDEHISVGNHQA